jgi:hypothetical protein
LVLGATRVTIQNQKNRQEEGVSIATVCSVSSHRVCFTSGRRLISPLHVALTRSCFATATTSCCWHLSTFRARGYIVELVIVFTFSFSQSLPSLSFVGDCPAPIRSPCNSSCTQLCHGLAPRLSSVAPPLVDRVVLSASSRCHARHSRRAHSHTAGLPQPLSTSHLLRLSFTVRH